jgi:sugar/nucleoside kinase (ribokinase family)
MNGITIIGNINADIIARPVAALPAPGTEQTIESIELRVGGAGAIAALCLAGLGSTAELVGSVGDDALGRLLLEELLRGGVPVKSIAVSGETGICIATEAADRDRSFLIAPGSPCQFSLPQIPDRAVSAQRLLVCGYFLLPALRYGGAGTLLQRARARGDETFLDTGWDPDGWTAETRNEVLGLLAWVDVFLPNEAEAMAIAGEPDVHNAVRALQARSGRWCIVKRGPKGSMAVGPGGTQFAIMAPAVQVADTTGAGDAFNAGILQARSEGRPWDEAIGFATLLASTVVSRPSRDRYPKRHELHEG